MQKIVQKMFWRKLQKLEQNKLQKAQQILRHCGKGGVAILINKNLQFSTREIPCLATNNIVGIQVTLCDTVPLFIFGVYLPSDNVLDDYKANIDIMQGLYEQ